MTVTVSTDYRTNRGPLENIIDGSRTTYWSALDAQTAGKSIVFSFSSPVTFFGMTAVSGSANGTQILSGTALQVSRDGANWKDVGAFDGNKISVIDGLYETRVTAVRIFWNGKINKKLAFYEAELDYREEHIYVKKDGVWVPVQKMLRRADSVWSENDDYAELNNRDIISRT